MADESNKLPETEVPIIAIRIAQILVSVLVLILVALAAILLLVVAQDKSFKDGPSRLLTNIACGLAVGCTALKFYVQDSIFRFLAWYFASPKTAVLSSFKRGAHFVCGATICASWYYFLGQFCWIVFYLEHQGPAAAFGVTMIPLMLVEFPTKARAKAWGERYFVRPVPLPSV